MHWMFRFHYCIAQLWMCPIKFTRLKLNTWFYYSSSFFWWISALQLVLLKLLTRLQKHWIPWLDFIHLVMQLSPLSVIEAKGWGFGRWHHNHRNQGEHTPAKTSFGENHTAVRLHGTLQGNYWQQGRRTTYRINKTSSYTWYTDEPKANTGTGRNKGTRTIRNFSTGLSYEQSCLEQ